MTGNKNQRIPPATWKKIKGDYEIGVSIAELSEHYGVLYGRIYTRAQKEKWESPHDPLITPSKGNAADGKTKAEDTASSIETDDSATETEAEPAPSSEPNLSAIPDSSNYERNKADAKLVKTWATHGCMPRDIAEALGISPPVLLRHYKDELTRPLVMKKNEMMARLFELATRDEKPNMQAAKIWMDEVTLQQEVVRNLEKEEREFARFLKRLEIEMHLKNQVAKDNPGVEGGHEDDGVQSIAEKDGKSMRLFTPLPAPANRRWEGGDDSNN